MRRRILAIGAVLILTASGCAGHHSSSSGTVPGPNPDVIPAVITVAYVNAVFRVLNHVYGNATRSLVAAKAVTPAVTADLRAIFNDPLYAKELQIAAQSVTSSLANVKKPPGDIATTVVELISASPTCIFVSTSADYGAVLKNPGKPPASAYWGLRRKSPSDDPGHVNPTAWALFFNAVYLTPTSISNQCGGS
jgi:hypothetical protein